MSTLFDIDLRDWEVVVEQRASDLPRWVVEEYCARVLEPKAIHASAYDGRLRRWVIVDYLTESF